MMSGLVSPKSIGLTNREEIYKLIKQSKLWFSLCRCNNQILGPILSLAISLLPFVLNFSALDTIIFAFLAFLYLITNASSVNYEANKMYKLLNHIMVYNSSSRLRFSTRNHLMIAYSTKIKVKIN